MLAATDQGLIVSGSFNGAGVQIAYRLWLALARRPCRVTRYLSGCGKNCIPLHLDTLLFLPDIRLIVRAISNPSAISDHLDRALYRSSRLSFLLISACLFSNLAHSASAEWPAEPQGENLAQGLSVYNAGFEASGIAYHDELGFLIVGDDGDVANVSEVGVVEKYKFLGGDFEGIALKNGTADFAYIANENLSAIVEISLPNLSVTGRSWPLQLAKNGGLGFEGITFVPQSEAPAIWGQAIYDGFFIAASQADTELRIFNIDTRVGSVSPVAPSASIETNSLDLSGLHFSATTRRLYALHDSANTLTKINLSGETLAVYATPASGAEEGVVLVEPPSSEDTYIVLADDAGPIAIRYDHFQSTDTDESSESTVSAAVLWLILRASQPPMD
ncbi:SdiA-regulated domain-containing protein [Luminiphilus sp.]|nr:SdiA-regulated domain-containing protein [Luminiphilus sp.]MDA8986347.1 SdiA-regulated domain-containing protein [Luminiphilus sp.]